MDILALTQQCAPAIEQRLATSLMRQESSFNPFAIGMDGKESLRPQPASFDQAVQKAEELIKAGKTFSVGIAQIHINNVRSFGLTWRQAFDPCTNLKYGQSIFQDFHRKAIKAGFVGTDAVYAGLRGYNSGNIYAAVSDGYATKILGRIQAINTPISRRLYAPASAKTDSQSADASDFFSNYLAILGEDQATMAASDHRPDGQSKDFMDE